MTFRPTQSRRRNMKVHLKIVFGVTEKEKLYAKFSSVNIWLDKCIFLVTVVNHNIFTWTPTNVVSDALSRKEKVKSRRVRGMILVLLVGSVMDEAHASRYLVKAAMSKTLACCSSLRYLRENEIESPWILSLNFQDNSKEWNSCDDKLRLRWMIYLVVLADAIESVRDAIGFKYCLASSNGWCAPFEALYRRKCRSPVLWAKIRESSLTGLELVQETTNKVVLIKEKLKAARDRQESYADNRRKQLEFEMGD
ncbi:hypothetical protein Tco_1197641 [Tanacetum coccineum]